MFNWIKRLFSENSFHTGALPDTRTQAQKDLDYKAKEIVAKATPVVWVKKTQYKSFPIRKQGSSGSCVMQSLEKERGIIAQNKYGSFVEFSANPGYQLRDNPSSEGSTYLDLIRATNYGGILESISPSQSMSDSQMMSATKQPYFSDMAKPFASYRVTLPLDIDAIASTIEATQKGVGLTVRFGPGEWFYNKQVKELLPETNWFWGHRVVAVDYTLNDEGVKCLVIEDSSCEDGYPQKLVPEHFLLTRTYWDPNYIVNFKTYIERPDKPNYVFTKTLNFGMNDPDVLKLQKSLQYFGFFPSNADGTNYFGSITAKGVLAWQIENNVDSLIELKKLQGKIFGPKSILKMNDMLK